MNRLFFRTCCLLLILQADLQGKAQSPAFRDEFNGPFTSWANVKQKFGAVGDGKTDDTRALQSALDNLTDERFGINSKASGAYSVVYLPKGTYRITKPLMLTNKIGIIISGEDPEQTSLLFDGPDNNTMLYSNGSSYYQVSRLKFLTNNKKEITGIGIHWHFDLNSGNSYAPQGIEITECIFKGGFAKGIAGGSFTTQQRDATCSEISIRNCHFFNCTYAGIAIDGYNALDYWIWNCRFYSCNMGVDNRFGNYHIYSSYFKKSGKTDVFNHHGYYSSIRGCYSDSSKYFYMDDGYSCNPFKRVLESNIVKASGDFPIEYSDFGFMTLINNYFFRNQNKDFAFIANIVTRNAICESDDYKIFSIGNYYEYSTPFRINKQLYRNYNYTSGDYGFGKQAILPDEKKWLANILIPFVPKATRKVFDVNPGASAAEIQAVVDEASSTRWKGTRPIVHFPIGKFTIDRTIIVPPGSDIQFIGDGYLRSSTLIAAQGLEGQYFFRIKGPTYIVMRNLQIGQETGRDDNQYGVLLENIDQRASFVGIDQMRCSPDATAMQVNKLANTYLQKTNSYYAYHDEIIGSSLHETGKAAGSVNLFGGQFGFFTVTNGARYFVKDTWFEGTMKKELPFRVQGNSNIVIDCVRLGIYDKGPAPILKVNDFTGRFVLMNSYVDNSLQVDMKNNKGLILLMNLFMNYDPIILNNSRQTLSRFNMLGINSDQQKKTVSDISDSVSTPALIRKMVDYTKDVLPRYYTQAAPGITNTMFTRVAFGNVRIAYKLVP